MLQSVQQLKTKAWADIVESLIGLVYLEAGENATMEFLVYLGVLPEVPCGFTERAPSPSVVEELDRGVDDAQLAADIAAAESAAAAMNLSEQQQLNGTERAKSMSVASHSAAGAIHAMAVPGVLPEPDTKAHNSDTDMQQAASGQATGSQAAEAVLQADTDMADAATVPSATVEHEVAGSGISQAAIANVIAGPAHSMLPGATQAANPSGTAGTAHSMLQGTTQAANPSGTAGTAQGVHAAAAGKAAAKSGMLGVGLADFQPAMWSGPVVTSAVRGSLPSKTKPGKAAQAEASACFSAICCDNNDVDNNNNNNNSSSSNNISSSNGHNDIENNNITGVNQPGLGVGGASLSLPFELFVALLIVHPANIAL